MVGNKMCEEGKVDERGVKDVGLVRFRCHVLVLQLLCNEGRDLQCYQLSMLVLTKKCAGASLGLTRKNMGVWKDFLKSWGRRFTSILIDITY